MKEKTNTSLRNITLYVFSFALLAYVAWRAYFLSFTHDESLSYTILLGFHQWVGTPNNHLLNTFLMGIFRYLFGDSEFVLRLPNVLAFVLYLYAVITILKRLKNSWVFFLGVALLLLNPYLLDFFSLARGYGLSVGLVTMSLAYLLKNPFQTDDFGAFIRSFSFAFLFGALAFLSNLGLINYYIMLLAIFAVQGYFMFKSGTVASVQEKRKYFRVLVIAAVFMLIGIGRLLFLSRAHQLYFGAQAFSATFFGLVSSTFYFSPTPHWAYLLIKYALIFSFAAGIFLVVWKKAFTGKLSMILILNIALLAGLVLENLLFGAHYPPARTALYFISFWGLLICFLMTDVFTYFSKGKAVWIIISVLIALILAWNFGNNANLKYSKNWFYDEHTKDVMEIIQKETQQFRHDASVSNNWLFEPAMNYYRYSRYIKIDSVNRKGVDTNSLLIYRFNNDTIPKHYKILAKYKDNNTILLMRSDTVKSGWLRK